MTLTDECNNNINNNDDDDDDDKLFKKNQITVPKCAV